MAFSYTIQSQTYEGPVVRKIYGTWSGLYGDTAGTIQVGGTVRHAIFQKSDPLDLTYEIVPRVEVSTTNGISTITVENQDNVVNGIFELTIFGN
jgi:hypothetical protein